MKTRFSNPLIEQTLCKQQVSEQKKYQREKQDKSLTTFICKELIAGCLSDDLLYTRVEIRVTYNELSNSLIAFELLTDKEGTKKKLVQCKLVQSLITNKSLLERNGIEKATVVSKRSSLSKADACEIVAYDGF